MGKVGFSPIIGLAVVVALAHAAVFGAMSLANPAVADSHTDGSTMGYQGVAWEFDANPLFAGVGDTEIITAVDDRDPDDQFACDCSTRYGWEVHHKSGRRSYCLARPICRYSSDLF